MFDPTTIQALQATLNNASRTLAELRSEQIAISERLTVSINNTKVPPTSAAQREQELTQLIFEQHQLIMQTRISILELEHPPLLERVRTAQAALAAARATYQQAQEALVAAQAAVDAASTPLTNNSCECLALREELAQQEFERALALSVIRTGKPQRLVFGLDSRPSRYQPELQK